MFSNEEIKAEAKKIAKEQVNRNDYTNHLKYLEAVRAAEVVAERALKGETDKPSYNTYAEFMAAQRTKDQEAASYKNAHALDVENEALGREVSKVKKVATQIAGLEKIEAPLKGALDRDALSGLVSGLEGSMNEFEKRVKEAKKEEGVERTHRVLSNTIGRTERTAFDTVMIEAELVEKATKEAAEEKLIKSLAGAQLVTENLEKAMDRADQAYGLDGLKVNMALQVSAEKAKPRKAISKIGNTLETAAERALRPAHDAIIAEHLEDKKIKEQQLNTEIAQKTSKKAYLIIDGVKEEMEVLPMQPVREAKEAREARKGVYLNHVIHKVDLQGGLNQFKANVAEKRAEIEAKMSEPNDYTRKDEGKGRIARVLENAVNRASRPAFNEIRDEAEISKKKEGISKMGKALELATEQTLRPAFEDVAGITAQHAKHAEYLASMRKGSAVTDALKNLELKQGFEAIKTGAEEADKAARIAAKRAEAALARQRLEAQRIVERAAERAAITEGKITAATGEKVNAAYGRLGKKMVAKGAFGGLDKTLAKAESRNDLAKGFYNTLEAAEKATIEMKSSIAAGALVAENVLIIQKERQKMPEERELMQKHKAFVNLKQYQGPEVEELEFKPSTPQLRKEMMTPTKVYLGGNYELNQCVLVPEFGAPIRITQAEFTAYQKSQVSVEWSYKMVGGEKQYLSPEIGSLVPGSLAVLAEQDAKIAKLLKPIEALVTPDLIPEKTLNARLQDAQQAYSHDRTPPAKRYVGASPSFLPKAGTIVRNINNDFNLDDNAATQHVGRSLKI